MSPLARRPWAPERLDAPDHDPAVLAHSLRDVARANDWLGGTRSVRLALAPFLRAGSSLSLLDVGTGNGAVLRSIARFAAARNIAVRAIGLDAHPQMLRAARTAGPDVALVRADVRDLPFTDAALDVVLAVLTLHHVPDEDQVHALREMGRVARRAVIVAELERNRAHWLGARLLAATLWRRNPLTRHDGPVSVLRGYTRGELEALAARAGLVGKARRYPLFRLVLTAAGPAG